MLKLAVSINDVYEIRDESEADFPTRFQRNFFDGNVAWRCYIDRSLFREAHDGPDFEHSSVGLRVFQFLRSRQ